jgi:glycosyltransferase involved in cell wall biosynthesis
MTGATKKIFGAAVLTLPVLTLAGAFIALPARREINLLTLALAAIALCGGAILISSRPRRPFGAAGIYCAFYALLACWGTLSLIWVKNVPESLYSLMYIFIGAAVVIAVCAFSNTEKRYMRLLDIAAVCFTAVLALGIFESLTGIYIFAPHNPELSLKSVRGLRFPYACFQNTNDFSSYITLMLPFAMYDAVKRLKKPAGAAAAAAFALGTAYALTVAGARACMIAVGVMAAAGAAHLIVRRARGGRLAALLWGEAAAVAAVCFAALAFFASRPHQALTMANHSVRERWMLTGGALRMLADYPLTGVGTGNATTLMPYYTASIRPFNVHNMTLQILTEYGIIIFALYAAVLVSLAVRFLKRGRRLGALSGVCFAVICAYPVAGIASSDMTHLAALWLVPGLLLGGLRVIYPDPERDATGKKMLLDTFIDFGEMASGSSVRPQRMYDAFVSLGFDVTLLSGLQNRRSERRETVRALINKLERDGLPAFCYVEPPSGPFFNLCDHRLLRYLHSRGVPVGLFYRDAYWKFAPWWQIKGAKRFFIVLMQRFDLLMFAKNCDVMFYPSRSMAELFKFKRQSVLPPAGMDFILPQHDRTRRALYIGGVSPSYGTDNLLKAFEIINERENKDIKLTTVCREAENAKIFDGYAARPWLEIAHASGDEQLKPFYERADMAVYPSRSDFYMNFCMPVKIFEYLSRALPVVCTSCREIASFIEKTGIGIVTGDDAEAIAAGVIRMYDEPGLMDGLRENCEKALGENMWINRAQQAADEILAAARSGVEG